MTAIQIAKNKLRTLMRQRLSEVSSDSVRSQSSEATKLVLSTPEYETANRISIYLSMPRGEISTEAIVTDALQRGKKVFVPYTYKLRFNESERPSVVMDMVSLLSQEDYKSLESDAWGIPTPSKASIINRQKCLGDDEITHDRSPGGSVETDDLDVIIVPGMAFNHGLRRLGHGKGFYDYFLHRYQEMKVAKEGNSSKMPFVVGLALQEQLLKGDQEIPIDPSDWHLDALIVGDGSTIRGQ